MGSKGCRSRQPLTTVVPSLRLRFTSLAEAERIIEAWRLDYNLRRPHTSLRMRTPAAFAAARPFVKRQQPVTAVSDTAPPPEAVAAIGAPMLSGSSGFS